MRKWKEMRDRDVYRNCSSGSERTSLGSVESRKRSAQRKVDAHVIRGSTRNERFSSPRSGIELQAVTSDSAALLASNSHVTRATISRATHKVYFRLSSTSRMAA